MMETRNFANWMLPAALIVLAAGTGFGGAGYAQSAGGSGSKSGIKVLDLNPPGKGDGSGGAAGGGAGTSGKRGTRPAAGALVMQPPRNRAIGTLSEGTGGLGTRLWVGSKFIQIEDMMARLPVDTATPAMRSLMRRMLLTGANPPADLPKDRSLLAVRAERLYAMADANSVAALLGRAEDLLDNVLARMRIDALLLAAMTDEACVLVGDTLAAHPSHYIQKVNVFCQAHRKMAAQSRINLELVREEAVVAGGAAAKSFKEFEELYLRIGQKKPKPVRRLTDRSPLHLAMLHAANLAVPTRAVKGLDFPRRLGVARSPYTRADVRLPAAEAGVATGALDVSYLEQAYGAMRIKGVTPERVRSTPARSFGPRQRAMFHAAARNVPDPASRARILARAFELGRQTGTALLVLHASQNLVRAVPPSPDLAWFAGDAARALYALGDASNARFWLKTLQPLARPGTPEDRVLTALWPIARIGDSFAPPPPGAGRLPAWIALQRETGGADAERRVLLMVAILSALGEPTQGVDAAGMLASVREAALAGAGVRHWQTVQQASRDGKRGETVLAALLALGEAGARAGKGPQLGRIDPYTAGVILAGLRRVGLEDDARAIALDIVLAAGL